MVSTLYDRSKECLEQLGVLEIDEWYFAFPAACVLMVGQIDWTANVEQALTAIHAGEDAKALARYNEKWIGEIDHMVGLVRTQLTPMQRKLKSAKITIDVHARYTVTAICEHDVSWVNDFEWQRQLRYYWEEDDDDCIVRQTNTRFVYGYEYLGNSMRLRSRR